MTIQEFVSTLKDQREVSFPGGERLLPMPRYTPVPEILGDALTRYLSPGSQIHSGWQLAEFSDSWAGEHRWVLVVDDDLVEVIATAREDGGRDHQICDITTAALSLRTVSPEMDLMYLVRNGEWRFREAVLRVMIDDHAPARSRDARRELFKISMEGAVGPFMSFVRQLQEAARRARGRGRSDA